MHSIINNENNFYSMIFVTVHWIMVKDISHHKVEKVHVYRNSQFVAYTITSLGRRKEMPCTCNIEKVERNWLSRPIHDVISEEGKMRREKKAEQN